VSLIESTLAKLRRAGETEARPHGVVVPRSVSVPAGAVNRAPAPAVVATASEPKAEEPSKRVTIDLEALRAKGYLPEEGLERRFADGYRQIKRPLIEKALAGAADMRLIMVSSALPGDGKTFTSINLALSMARERDISVLLVDADAARARISELFGLRTERGLIDALNDDSLRVESLIVETNLPGLAILPAGGFRDSATELFASVRMDQIAARIRVRDPRRLVIFDTAPLLASGEARAMLRVLGQVVLVARAGVTPRHAIVDAAAQVGKGRLQGVVLNHVPWFAIGPGYHYDYRTP
jgi:protein-tyrosine kinase